MPPTIIIIGLARNRSDGTLCFVASNHILLKRKRKGQQGKGQRTSTGTKIGALKTKSFSGA
jgi:hypothetical protein